VNYLLVPAGAVLIGMLPLPIDAYHLIRWIVACTCAFGAYKIFQEDRADHYKGVILATIAFIFNPIIHFYLGRTLWLIIDVAVCVLLIWIVFGKRIADKTNESNNLNSEISAKLEKIEEKGDGFARQALVTAIGLLFVFALINIFMKK
jgi:Ca2+/Na+ antiporter